MTQHHRKDPDPRTGEDGVEEGVAENITTFTNCKQSLLELQVDPIVVDNQFIDKLHIQKMLIRMYSNHFRKIRVVESTQPKIESIW